MCRYTPEYYTTITITINRHGPRENHIRGNKRNKRNGGQDFKIKDMTQSHKGMSKYMQRQANQAKSRTHFQILMDPLESVRAALMVHQPNKYIYNLCLNKCISESAAADSWCVYKPSSHLIHSLSREQLAAFRGSDQNPPSTAPNPLPTSRRAQRGASLAPACGGMPEGGPHLSTAPFPIAPARPVWSKTLRATSTRAARRTSPATAQLWWDQR